jgi:hypothetical protein
MLPFYVLETLAAIDSIKPSQSVQSNIQTPHYFNSFKLPETNNGLTNSRKKVVDTASEITVCSPSLNFSYQTRCTYTITHPTK